MPFEGRLRLHYDSVYMYDSASLYAQLEGLLCHDPANTVVWLQAYIEFCTRCRNIAVQSDFRTANYDANNCQLRIPASGSHVDVRWQLQALSESLSARSS